MKNITPLDDFPIHQTSETLSVPSTTDRNFYDRYWFNGFSKEKDFLFEIGVGVYPNRHIIDGHFSISFKGKQYSFHASKRLDSSRYPMVIGPISLEIPKPMEIIKFTLQDPEKRISCNLEFNNLTLPHIEPKSSLKEGTRILMDTSRFTQFGTWTGEIQLENLLSNVLPPELFSMQYSFSNGEQVDAIVKVGKYIIPIDAKFSLDNYNKMIESENKDELVDLEKKFKSDIKNRIDETAKYIRPNEKTTDYAYMFIPADGLYQDLLNSRVGSLKINQRDLVNYAYEKKVMIVSPMSLFPMLQITVKALHNMKAVSYTHLTLPTNREV